jgi:hypothetical protein
MMDDKLDHENEAQILELEMGQKDELLRHPLISPAFLTFSRRPPV